MTTKPLRGLLWAGGKSPAASTGTGRWIAGMLPAPSGCSVYAEPFCGMAGVLLHRAPAPSEVVNDLDGRVTNWWRVVRDRPEELSRLIALTPKSRPEFVRACADAETDPVRRALDFTIVCSQSLAGRHEPTAWGIFTNGARPDWAAGMDGMVLRLAQRMRNVQIEERDAVELLGRLAREERAVVYVDPPYADTWGTAGAYAFVDDRERLTDALLAQRGRVAVSGYEDEWDHLRWQRHEHATVTSLGSHRGDAVRSRARTEVCWTNFSTGEHERFRQACLGIF